MKEEGTSFNQTGRKDEIRSNFHNLIGEQRFIMSDEENCDIKQLNDNITCELQLENDKLEDDLLAVGDIEPSEETTSEAGLSKRARKKLLKRQQWLDTKHERRAKEREKRKVKMAALKLVKEFDETRVSSRKSLKHSKMSDSSCKVGVVFDMQFGDLMTQRDLGKCIKQIMKCYSLNRRLSAQLQLYMTSLGGSVEEEMSKHDGFKNWDFNFDSRRYDEVFTRDRIVYLSSDSTREITHLEDDKVYIIGGLVDHNHHKGLCHEKATQLGIETARLPIDQFVDMKSRKVLTVNHVFEILATVSQGKEWKEAFLGVIPERKGAVALKDEEKAEEDIPETDKFVTLEAECEDIMDKIKEDIVKEESTCDDSLTVS